MKSKEGLNFETAAVLTACPHSWIRVLLTRPAVDLLTCQLTDSHFVAGSTNTMPFHCDQVPMSRLRPDHI